VGHSDCKRMKVLVIDVILSVKVLVIDVILSVKVLVIDVILSEGRDHGKKNVTYFAVKRV
jgi:hypothetical protein